MPRHSESSTTAVLPHLARDSFVLPPHLLGMQETQVNTQNGPAAAPTTRLTGHASKPSNSETGFSHGAYNSNNISMGGYGDRHPRRANVPSINTQSMSQQHGQNDLQTPGTGLDMQFTPLLPSQLLLGSPFQPGTPANFVNPQYQSFGFAQQQQQNNQHHHQQNLGSPVQSMSPQLYQTLVSPSAYGAPQFYNPQSPTGQFVSLGNQMQQLHIQPSSPVHMTPAMVSGTSRTVYLGNIPPETSARKFWDTCAVVRLSPSGFCPTRTALSFRSWMEALPRTSIQMPS